MNKSIFYVAIALFFLILIGCSINTSEGTELPWDSSNEVTPTYTSTPEPTPTLPMPEPPLQAVLKEDGNCLSGTDSVYEILVTIPQFEQVFVIRKNSVGTWFLIRRENSINDCWIEESRLSYRFDVNMLQVTSTPPPPTPSPTSTKVVIFISPTKTPKPDESSNGSGNSAGQTQAAQAQTAQAAIAQTQAAQALTAQAAIAQTQTAQALTAQAAIAQTQTAQALTAQAAIAQTQTAQALTAQAAYWQTQTALACIISAPKLSGSRNGQNVKLSWSSVSGASGYEVFVSVNGGPESSLGKTNGTSANDSISNGSTNVYHVVAYSPCGNKYDSDSNAETIVR